MTSPLKKKIAIKQLKYSTNKCYYQPPDDKQFTALSLISKQSGLGFKSHERLLLFDSKQKSLAYFNNDPDSILQFKQLENEEFSFKLLPEAKPKQIIFIKKIKIFSFRSTRSNIGKVKVEWVDLNSNKNVWLIGFVNNTLMNQWIMMVNLIIKDGHLKPGSNQKSKRSWRESKVSSSKYMTNFMKETINLSKDEDSKDNNKSRDNSASKTPFWGKGIKQSDDINFTDKDNTSWLISKVAEKDKEIQQIARKNQENSRAEEIAQSRVAESKVQQQEQQSRIQQEGINEKMTQLKQKSLEDSFLTRNVLSHFKNKAVIEQMKEKQVKVSRQEQFRKKIIEKSLQKSRLNQSNSNQKSNEITQRKKSMKKYENTYDPLVVNISVRNQKPQQPIKSQNTHNVIPIATQTEQVPIRQKPKESVLPHVTRIHSHQNRFKQLSEIEQQRQKLNTDNTTTKNNKQTQKKTSILDHIAKSQQINEHNKLNPSIINVTKQNNSEKTRQKKQQVYQQHNKIRSDSINRLYNSLIQCESSFTDSYSSYHNVDINNNKNLRNGLLNSIINYQKFIQNSRNMSKLIINNLSLLIDEAQNNINNKNLFIDKQTTPNQPTKIKQILTINRQSTTFKIHINSIRQQKTSTVSMDYLQCIKNWHNAPLKLQQYSSIVSYIRKLIQRGRLGHRYENCMVVDFCMVMYKWNVVECKSVISKNWVLITEYSENQELNRLFEVPSNTWKYYKNSGSGEGKEGSCLLIDYAVQNLEIHTPIDMKVIDSVASRLAEEDVVCSSIADLCDQLAFTYSSVLSPDLIYEIVRVINQKNLQARLISSNLSLLYSIIYGLKCSEYIWRVLSKHMFDMQEGELYENIDQITKMSLQRPYILKRGQTQMSSNHISRGVSEMFLQCIELKKLRQPEQDQLIENIIFSTILYLLGIKMNTSREFMSRAPNHNNQSIIQSFHGNKYSLQFDIQYFGIAIQSYSIEMQTIKSILMSNQSTVIDQQENTDTQNEDEETKQKYNQYMKICQFLDKFHSHESKKLSTIVQNDMGFIPKYLNLNSRIRLFQSLFSPEMPIAQSGAINTTGNASTIIWQQPPTRYSYLLGINCTKWAIKKNNRSTGSITQLLIEQVTNCQFWSGFTNHYLVLYYQLFSLYACSVFDFNRSIYYARLSLEVTEQKYGEQSANAIEKLYQLGNILIQAEIYEQALDVYLRSLDLMLNYPQQELTQSKKSTSSLLYPSQTKNAQLQLRSKIAAIYLTLGKIPDCLSQSLKCLKLCKQNQNRGNNQEGRLTELKIFFQMVRCYEITKQQKKLIHIIDVIGHKFAPFSELSNKSIHRVNSGQFMEAQAILKMCLYPYLRNKLFILSDKNRIQSLQNIVYLIQKQYKSRYSKQQYQIYFSKWLYPLHKPYRASENLKSFDDIYHNSQSKKTLKVGSSRQQQNRVNSLADNIFEKITEMFLHVPIFGSKSNELPQYSLYANSHKAKNINQSVSQDKYCMSYRIIESLCGIVGYQFINQCLYYYD